MIKLKILIALCMTSITALIIIATTVTAVLDKATTGVLDVSVVMGYFGAMKSLYKWKHEKGGQDETSD